MGRFDSIEKFLGKEENFSPAQVNAGLDTLDGIPERLSDVGEQALDNVEKLLQSEGVGVASSSSPPAAPVDMGQSVSLSEELLNELAVLDGPPPQLDELQSRFSSLRDIMVNVQEGAEEGGESAEGMEPAEMPFASEAPSEAPSLEEMKLTVPEGEVDAEVADLLGQMRAETEKPSASSGGIEDLLSSLGVGEELTGGEPASSVEPSFPSEEAFSLEEPALPSEEETFGGLSSQGGEPEISLEGFGETGIAEPEIPIEGFETSLEQGEVTPQPYEFPSFDESGGEPPLGEIGGEKAFAPSIESPFGEVPSPMEPKAAGASESFSPPSFDFEKMEEETPSFGAPAEQFGSSQELLLDPEKAVRIRERINRIRKPDVRQRIREAIVKGKLPEETLRELLVKLLLNEPDATFEVFDQRYLKGIEVERRTAFQPAAPARKVIYTEEALKAEKLNQQLGKVGGLSLLILLFSVALGALMWRGVVQPALAAKEYEKGLKAIDQKDFVFAEKKFQRGKEIGGFSVKWHNIYAQKYTGVGQWELARQKYEAVLQRKPLDRQTIFNYAEFNKQLYPPRYEEAVSLYTRLYKRSAGDFGVVDALGQTYVEWAERIQDPVDRLEKFKKANDLYETYLMKKSRDVGAHFRLLDIAVRITNETLIDGRYKIIEKLNKKAINFPILTRLASYYIDKRRLSDARKVLDKLIPLIKIKIRESDGGYVLDPSMNKFSNQKPVYDETLYQYGRFQTINLDFVRALWALSNAVGLNPSNAKAYNLMGEIYYTTDERPEPKRMAISLFETAQRIAPFYYKPYVNLGHLYFYNDLAFKDEEGALFKALGYYKVAYQLYQMGQIDRLAPDSKLFYNLSWLYYKYGNYEEALRVLSEIYTTDPLNPYYSYAIGNIYQKMGVGDLAEVNYLKAIDYFNDIAKRIKYINPDSLRHREVFTQLARAYNNLGVVYFMAAKQNPKMAQEYEARALLNFYNAKNMANKINVLYPEAEYNIKVVLNKGVRGRMARMDDTLVKRTTLQRILEELKNGMIDSL